MRTDAQIDRKQVRLPNSSFSGYSKGTAQHGDIVIWNDNGQRRIARVAGRVAYAPESGNKDQGTYTPTIRNNLFLIVLNNTLSYKYIRWVDPSEIQECYSMEDYKERIVNNLHRFFSEEFLKQKTEEIAKEVEN